MRKHIMNLTCNPQVHPPPTFRRTSERRQRVRELLNRLSAIYLEIWEQPYLLAQINMFAPDRLTGAWEVWDALSEACAAYIQGDVPWEDLQEREVVHVLKDAQMKHSPSDEWQPLR